MAILLSLIVLTTTILMFRVLILGPAMVLSWLHLPLWLTLGVLGGLVAWCIADD